MVDIKAAVENAIEFAKTSLGVARTIDIRLEEVESSVLDGTPVWLITLSSVSTGNGILADLRAHATVVLGSDEGREYKVFTVAKSTGDVLSMKIRLLALPAG